MEIRRFTTETELRRAFRVMRELRPHLTEESYFRLLEDMTREGYELWGLSEDGTIRALAGIAVRTNFYYGRYVWVFDLVTARAEQSKGYGATLLKHIEDRARDRGCDAVALSSAVHRTRAHRFYQEKMGYEMPSYVFKKVLPR